MLQPIKFKNLQRFQSTTNKQQALKKSDLPIFKGEDVKGWIRSIKHYLRINKILDQERLELVLTSMEGMALHWFIWTEDHYFFKDWQDFKIQISARFGHSLSNNILHQFLNRVQ